MQHGMFVGSVCVNRNLGNPRTCGASWSDSTRLRTRPRRVLTAWIGESARTYQGVAFDWRVRGLMRVYIAAVVQISRATIYGDIDRIDAQVAT
jgi:hypothetical protein